MKNINNNNNNIIIHMLRTQKDPLKYLIMKVSFYKNIFSIDRADPSSCEQKY